MRNFGKFTAMALIGLCLGMILAAGMIGPEASADKAGDSEAGWCNSHCHIWITQYEKCNAQCRYKSGHSGSHTCLRWHTFSY